MGLLFRRKESIRGDKKYSSVRDIYKVRDSDFNKLDAEVVADKIKFNSSSERSKFREFLDKAQTGGVEWKEVHGYIQEKVGEGKISYDKAREMSRELGMTNEDQRKFKTMSDYNRAQKKENHAEKEVRHWDHGSEDEDKDSKKKTNNAAPTDHTSPAISLGGSRFDQLSSNHTEDTSTAENHKPGQKSLATLLREQLFKSREKEKE